MRGLPPRRPNALLLELPSPKSSLRLSSYARCFSSLSFWAFCLRSSGVSSTLEVSSSSSSSMLSEPMPFAAFPAFAVGFRLRTWTVGLYSDLSGTTPWVFRKKFSPCSVSLEVRYQSDRSKISFASLRICPELPIKLSLLRSALGFGNLCSRGLGIRCCWLRLQ